LCAKPRHTLTRIIPPLGSFCVRSLEEDKCLDHSLAQFGYLESDDIWGQYNAYVPGKGVGLVKSRFNQLQDDIATLEAGCVSLPGSEYEAEEVGVNTVTLAGNAVTGIGNGLGLHVSTLSCSSQDTGGTANTASTASTASTSTGGHMAGDALSGKTAEQERRKGIPWTEEEHRSFLLGLTKFGKGDWRSISRSCVISRTPTQVASHAQKYFIRLNSLHKKDRRRPSIHDITSANGGKSGGKAGAVNANVVAGSINGLMGPSQTSRRTVPERHVLRDGRQLPSGWGTSKPRGRLNCVTQQP